MEDLRCKKCNEYLYTEHDDEFQNYDKGEYDLYCLVHTCEFPTLICINCKISYFPCMKCTQFFTNDDDNNFDACANLKKVSNLQFCQIVAIPDDENPRPENCVHYDVNWEYDSNDKETNVIGMKNNSSISELAEIIAEACRVSNNGVYNISSWNLCEWNKELTEKYLLNGPDGGKYFILYCKECKNYSSASDK
jgi:hypothetical protein